MILFLIQFVLGIIHHFVIFRRSSSDKETTSTTPPRQSNPYFRLAHIWLGRAAWIIAACEGGTGLVLAANSPNGEKVYGSIVGIVGVLWIGIVVTSMVWKRNATGTGKQAEKQTDESVAAAGMGSGDVEEIAVRMEKDTGA